MPRNIESGDVLLWIAEGLTRIFIVGELSPKNSKYLYRPYWASGLLYYFSNVEPSYKRSYPIMDNYINFGNTANIDLIRTLYLDPSPDDVEITPVHETEEDDELWSD